MIISRLAQIRTERHITTAALAKKSGVSQSTITRIENNMDFGGYCAGTARHYHRFVYRKTLVDQVVGFCQGVI